MGVTAAALGLVAAVWGALEIAPEATTPGTGDSRAAMAEGDSPLSARSLALLSHPSGTAEPDSLLGFVRIEAGPFTMGSDPGVDPMAFDVEWWGNGRVQGEVTLPAFYMHRFEVTVAQFADFVGASGYPADPAALRGAPDHPVTSVSWTDAVAYTHWLDAALRAAPATPGDPSTAPAIIRLLAAGWHISLPTEAQWEKAARGRDGRIYPWGNEPRPDRARYRARGPAPVGSFPCPECPYALSDMSGNVWEWTRSPYQPYPYDEADDRDGLTSEALWVMRGGSFADTEQYVRAANRGGADPGARRPFIGFRIALVPPRG